MHRTNPVSGDGPRLTLAEMRVADAGRMKRSRGHSGFRLRGARARRAAARDRRRRRGRPPRRADGGAAFFALMNDVGLREVRLTSSGTRPPHDDREQAEIEAMLPFAALRGVNVVFSVAPARARLDRSSRRAGRSSPRSPRRSRERSRPSRTSSSATSRTSPASGSRSSTRAAGTLRRRLRGAARSSYDALKAVDPGINVIGVGLSPRGNDNPRASGNVSRLP